MSPMGDGVVSLIVIVAVAMVAHEPWRLLGAYLGRSLSAEDEIFVWVKLVSTAIVAGLVMRLVVFPVGALEHSPIWLRGMALVAGVAAFYLARRHLLVGILVGCAVIATGGL